MYTNVWYVAAFGQDLTDAPVLVRMLGADFVLFRDADGKVQCVSNVCPHRGASLADGTLLKDGSLACPFHGWRFDGAGACTLIPSRRDHEVQAVAPGTRVDAYAAQERYGLVWVCVGDDPEAASPIPEIPEWDGDEFRFTQHEEVWEANYHTAKFTNLDYVHLPVVHGIPFRNQQNPTQAPAHQVTVTEYGFTSVMQTVPKASEGVWSTLRDEDRKVESVMKFFVAGMTLRGQVEIGGVGSGVFNMFYEFSTPIDAETTMMRYYFLRNYKREEAFDTEHTRRNLQNIHQDKAIAEAQRPKAAPVGPNPRGIYTHDEDKIMLAYWSLMERMRERGWQIDRDAMITAEHRGELRVIPSPARRHAPDGWVYAEMPRYTGRPASAAAISELSYVDVDALTPTRPADYGSVEPVRPEDPKSNATLEWESAALKVVEQAPTFVQPMIIENAEKAARQRGTNMVTAALLQELQAQQSAGRG